MARGSLFLLLVGLAFWAPAARAVVITPEVVIMDATADIQNAIDATVNGGVLRLGPGVFVPPDSAGWFISKHITIEGVGIGRSDSAGYGTMLRPYLGDTDSPSAQANVFTITSGGVTIRNLCISNQVAASASSDTAYGCGVLIDASGGSLERIVLENVLITNLGGCAVGLLSAGEVTDLQLRFCDLRGNTTGSVSNYEALEQRNGIAYFDGSAWYAATFGVVP